MGYEIITLRTAKITDSSNGTLIEIERDGNNDIVFTIRETMLDIEQARDLHEALGKLLEAE